MSAESNRRLTHYGGRDMDDKCRRVRQGVRDLIGSGASSEFAIDVTADLLDMEVGAVKLAIAIANEADHEAREEASCSD